MPLKLAMIIVPPLIVTTVVLHLVGVPWDTIVKVAAVMIVCLFILGLCDRMRQIRSPWEQEQQAAESMAALQQESALGLGASAIASLPVYRYEKKGGDGAGSDECSICLGEIKKQETVKQLPVCAHLFHEGCIDMWLRSHRTCPVCRSPVIALAAPASLEIDVRHHDNSTS